MSADHNGDGSGFVEGWEDELDVEKARQIDEDMEWDQAQDLAMRKLFNRLGSRPEEDIGPVECTYRIIDKMDNLALRVATLEDQIDKIDRAAQTALTIAEREAKPGDSVSKKRVAMLKSRNELIRRLAKIPSSRVSTSVGEIQEMSKPEVLLHYQTVKDAWEELSSEWSAFSVGENPEGERVLRAEQEELDPALVKAVESDLGRDDLTKRLISGRRGEGG